MSGGYYSATSKTVVKYFEKSAISTIIYELIPARDHLYATLKVARAPSHNQPTFRSILISTRGSNGSNVLTVRRDSAPPSTSE